MSQDPLDYQLLLQDALLGLVRRSLEIVAAQGLPGDHHFFLTFRTAVPGVVMPPHMRDTYPEEMTIVLRAKFKDLEVAAEEFSVGLFFGGVLYYLTVPFAALVAFVDPSAGFQLTFQRPAESAGEGPAAEASEPAGAGPVEGGRPVADNVVAFSGFRKK